MSEVTTSKIVPIKEFDAYRDDEKYIIGRIIECENSLYINAKALADYENITTTEVMRYTKNLSTLRTPNGYPLHGALFIKLSDIEELCEAMFVKYEKGKTYFEEILEPAYEVEKWYEEKIMRENFKFGEELEIILHEENEEGEWYEEEVKHSLEDIVKQNFENKQAIEYSIEELKDEIEDRFDSLNKKLDKKFKDLGNIFGMLKRIELRLSNNVPNIRESIDDLIVQADNNEEILEAVDAKQTELSKRMKTMFDWKKKEVNIHDVRKVFDAFDLDITFKVEK